ncbi:MAG: SIMPL domain-containing protein [Sphaerochaetaceae bacterium]|nr:SIMPL domain-containing protein [Sphaerochaetaceae bacterium]
MKRSTILITTIAALLAVAMLSSCSTLSKLESSTTVSVSGSGTVYLDADMVTFSINIDETRDTTALAQQATNKKMSEVLAILRQFNIADKDISTTALNFGSRTEWQNGAYVKIGESVSQTVYVTMREIDKFSALADAIGSQVSGIDFYNVNFNASNRADATEKARELAYQDALAKAKLYASCAGLDVESPISINEGYSNYGAYTYANTSAKYLVAEAAMAYDTEVPTGLLSVTVNVDVTFRLED